MSGFNVLLRSRSRVFNEIDRSIPPACPIVPEYSSSLGRRLEDLPEPWVSVLKRMSEVPHAEDGGETRRDGKLLTKLARCAERIRQEFDLDTATEEVYFRRGHVLYRICFEPGWGIRARGPSFKAGNGLRYFEE
jgi:hypothetical protein